MEPAAEVLPSRRRFPSAELPPTPASSVALYEERDRKRRYLGGLNLANLSQPLKFDVRLPSRPLTCGESLDPQPPNDDITDWWPLRCLLSFCLCHYANCIERQPLVGCL